MTGRGKNTVAAVLLLIVLLAGSILTLAKINSLRGSRATLEDVLYMPSGKVIKRMSLGYSGLLADVYWTRAVQYFGSRHMAGAMHYDLLYPLLDITTDLDPQLIVAYQDGSIFLSEQPPEGAGQPDKAVALIEKGIRANPSYWRLYFTLGFIQYQNRHDYRAAQEAFEKGSEIHGALPWMKVMAARMAERGKDIGTAAALWQAVYEMTSDKQVKHTAQLHLASIQADLAINELERRVQIYLQRTGKFPSDWADMERAGLLRGVPLDPGGDPYQLKPGGKVEVLDANKYPYLGEWRDNRQRPF
ncbi:MAG: tetratricopeptide repeat protein [Actinomycetota bacterium]